MNEDEENSDLKKEPKKETLTKVTKKKVPKKKVASKKQVEKLETVVLRNRMFQLLNVEIKDRSGKFVAISIPARSDKTWPKLDDYGADVKIKVKRKLLQVLG